MVSYSSIKAFINTFTTSLRLLAAPCGVDVVCVQPGFIDTQMTKRMREQGGVVGQSLLGSAEELAARTKEGVEKGGRGLVIWPEIQGVVMYALRGVFYCGDWECYYRLNLGLQERTQFAKNSGSGSS
jgi:short-subunit dehydrogenase